MLYDLKMAINDIKVEGVDISNYAINNSKEEVKKYLKVADAKKLPYEDNSFDVVISINTIHNLERKQCVKAVKEIERLAPGKGFIQVDSYKNEEQKKIFESWVLTAKYYGYTNEWTELFKEAGYTGFYYWTIIE